MTGRSVWRRRSRCWRSWTRTRRLRRLVRGGFWEGSACDETCVQIGAERDPGIVDGAPCLARERMFRKLNVAKPVKRDLACTPKDARRPETKERQSLQAEYDPIWIVYRPDRVYGHGKFRRIPAERIDAPDRTCRYHQNLRSVWMQQNAINAAESWFEVSDPLLPAR
jgi:hypothetical protein